MFTGPLFQIKQQLNIDLMSYSDSEDFKAPQDMHFEPLYRWLCVRLQYLQHISAENTVVLH